MDEHDDRPPGRKARGIALLLERTTRLVYDERKPNALHAVQWSALRYIELAPESRRSIACLARHLGVTGAPASRTASSLANRGLVSISASPSDMRARLLRLTQAGRAMLDRDPLNRCARIIETLDEEERNTLEMALDKLHARLSEDDERDQEDGDDDTP